MIEFLYLGNFSNFAGDYAKITEYLSINPIFIGHHFYGGESDGRFFV